MHSDVTNVAEHMQEFGCYVLGRAIYQTTFSEMRTPYAHALGVSLAAHAAEIIVKAKIASAHPLLIFDTLPKSSSTTDLLTVGDLLTNGKTIQYADLPERLWAATGYRIKDVKRYVDFGKLRNQIVHFAVPSINLSEIVLKFAFEILDPMLEDFWDESIISYVEIFDDVIVEDGYLQEQLTQYNITELTKNTQNALSKA